MTGDKKVGKDKSQELTLDSVPHRTSLNSIPVGQKAQVIEIQGGHTLADRLRALGIRPGVQVEKVSGQTGRGPSVIRHGRTQTALGRGICEKIIVELEP